MKIARHIFLRKDRRTLLILLLLSAPCAWLSYKTLLTVRNPFDNYTLLFLLYADIVLVLLLCVLLSRRLFAILKIRKKNHTSTKYHKQIIVLFSCITAIPAFCVFVFSMMFLNTGIDALFARPIKSTIENSKELIDIYVNDMKSSLENFAISVGEDLKSTMELSVVNQNYLNDFLNSATEMSGIDAIIFQKTDGHDMEIMAKTTMSLSLQFANIPFSLNSLNEQDATSWDDEKSIFVIQCLSKDANIYFMIRKNIDEDVIKQRGKLNKATGEYKILNLQRSGVKMTFMTLFSVVVCLMLIFSVLIGVIFATRSVGPINKLILAAKNVSLGNYKTKVAVSKNNNELDILVSSFNTMTDTLETQRKELIAFHRQDAWRDIARKIAHEIKNPLTPIQLSADRLKRKYLAEIKSDPETFEKCLDTIKRQVHSIEKLVSEFSNFARMPSPKIEDADVVSLIKEVLLMQSHANPDIEVVCDLGGANELVVPIDTAQINQVLINLTQNSINAIKENGEKKPGFIGGIYIKLFLDTDYYNIMLEDDGPGFKDGAIEHAFDPYFTTREKGSGLGLSIVHKIIGEHSGTIEIGRSVEYGGALVVIRMPLKR